MSKDIMNMVLIAPHADDEIIGAYSLIKKGLISTVYHIDASFNSERFKLAVEAGRELGFKTEMLKFREINSCLEKLRDEGSICLVPDPTDRHPLHRRVFATAKISDCNLGWYSTDMATDYVKELDGKLQKEKRAVLNRFYPDQKSLWKNDWRYFLFEGVVFDAACFF